MPTAASVGASGLPTVVLVATGGTIAGLAEGAGGQAYVPGALDVDSVVAAVPGLAQLARLRSRSVFAVDSVELDLPQQLELARAVEQELADPDVDAVVVTHGTDTLEESAYLLHLSITSDKPVVFAGSMRPADAVSADGPANLLNAVRVAGDPSARGLGTLVVVGEDVYGARGLRKVDTVRTAAFAGRYAALGEVTGGRVRWYARPVRPRGTFPLQRLPPALPEVELLVTRPGTPSATVTAAAAGVAGLVHLGPGGGNVATGVAAALDRVRRDGVVVVRAARVVAGPVERNGAISDDAHDWVAAGELSPYQARVLLALALTRTRDTRELQRYFDTH